MLAGIYKHRAPTERFPSRLTEVVRKFLSFSSIQILFVSCSIIGLTILPVRAQQLSREQWGAMPVTVSHSVGSWIIAGSKNKVTINEASLVLTVTAGPAKWLMFPSSAGDMLVKSGGEEFPLRLADAKKISIVPYDTCYKTGVKISLSEWTNKKNKINLSLFLTVRLEGSDE